MNYRFEGMICKECRDDEHLYADAHGIFCSRCGPAAPIVSLVEAWQSDRGDRLHRFGTIDATIKRPGGRL